MDHKALQAAATQQSTKDALRSNSERAVERGVFGVPTFLVDDQLFFGADRLHHLDAYLAGELQVPAGLLQQALQRPASASRNQS